MPSPAGGAYSTAWDIATFGQAFLSGGRHGDARLLSPASARAMTRNQIPGMSAHFFWEFFPEASWGLGWDVRGSKKSGLDGSLQSPATFGHGGGGVVFLWVDPAEELLVVYFSVALVGPTGAPSTFADLFCNAATAAVVDGA